MCTTAPKKKYDHEYGLKLQIPTAKDNINIAHNINLTKVEIFGNKAPSLWTEFFNLLFYLKNMQNMF